jgi:hypothetical protein
MTESAVARMWPGCLAILVSGLAVGALLGWVQDVNTTNALASCAGVSPTDSAHLPNTDVLLIFRVPIYGMCFGWGAVFGALSARRGPSRVQVMVALLAAVGCCAVAFCADLLLIVRPC